MAITEAAFESERELQNWVYANIRTFLPRSYLIDGFQITTISGKNSAPDGFGFNFDNREWYLIECELLGHGVWPHIAEQITRFVVALQNPDTLRKIRDRLFDYICDKKIISQVASGLGTVPERMHQQVELFIESVQPQIVIFIDEANQDLEDMAHALDIPTKIFRLKKFLVNGAPEYYSPDTHAPVIVSEPSEEGPSFEYDIVELLGGGKLETSVRRFKCYKLEDGSIVHIKKSKLYPGKQCYWYGISAVSLDYIKEYKVTHMVFIMGDFGFVKVPMSTIHQFLQHTLTSKNPDGSIRHYHCYISTGPEPELYITSDQPKYSLLEYFQPFD